jgi:hypothetical protein
MRESCTSGTVGGEGGNILVYPEIYDGLHIDGRLPSSHSTRFFRISGRSATRAAPRANSISCRMFCCFPFWRL